jgi:hypothetical protein
MLGRRFGGFSDQYMAVVARLLLSGAGRGTAMSLAMGAPGSELDRGRLVGAIHAMHENRDRSAIYTLWCGRGYVLPSLDD